MANFFVMNSSDSTYSYTNTTSANVTFELQDNNQQSNTQGFYRKIQVGENRIKAKVTLVDTKTNCESNLVPQQIHNSSVNVTFDRNIVTKSTATGEFVIEDIRLLQELGHDGEEQEYEVILTEVI